MIRSSSTASCPTGILAEVELAKAHPDRRDEIRELAITRREEELAAFYAAKKALSWHPVELIKTLLVAAVVTFSLAWSVAQVSAFGHWYASARTSKLSVSIPVIGQQALPIGEYLPTSTVMEALQAWPTFGITESAQVTLVTVAIVLCERLVVLALAWQKIQHLKIGAARRKDEMDALREWLA